MRWISRGSSQTQWKWIEFIFSPQLFINNSNMLFCGNGDENGQTRPQLVLLPSPIVSKSHRLMITYLHWSVTIFVTNIKL